MHKVIVHNLEGVPRELRVTGGVKINRVGSHEQNNLCHSYGWGGGGGGGLYRQTPPV